MGRRFRATRSTLVLLTAPAHVTFLLVTIGACGLSTSEAVTGAGGPGDAATDAIADVDRAETSTDDVVSSGLCPSSARRCGAACVRCPSGKEVVATACEGEVCISTACVDDFEPCGAGCCPLITFVASPIGGVGQHLSLMIDAADGVHVGYTGLTPTLDLFYRSPSGAPEVVAARRTSANGLATISATAALDHNGNPIFAYRYDDPLPETYVAKKDLAWTSTSMPLDTGAHTTVASGGGVDGVAAPLIGGIAAFRLGQSTPWLTCPGINLSLSDVAFRIDASGTPHLTCHPQSHAETDSYNLDYATLGRNGAPIIERVDDAGALGVGSSFRSQLALGSDGLPRIVYPDYVTREIKFARRTPAGWQRRVVAPFAAALGDGGISVWESALVVDKNGDAHVFYAEVFGTPLKHARETPTSFVIRPVTGVPRPFAEVEAELDSKGNIHVLCNTGSDLGIVHLIGTAP